MAFKRALWHSGLTYQQQCPKCMNIVKYDDFRLDFRPWYPDGFVYCPKCQTPLRHNERLAINPDGTPYYTASPEQPNIAVPSADVRFCSKCGHKYTPGKDNFCSHCGNKLN